VANVIEQKHPEGVGLEVLLNTRLFIVSALELSVSVRNC
jgi:hypothetical protein